MRRSFLPVSLALCGLSAVYFAGDAIAESDAERAARLEAEFKAFDRETRPVEKVGCKEYWSSDNRRSIERVIKACTKALQRSDWTTTQRGYVFHVRGAASAVADKLPEALADLDQAATLIPSYGPVYYERGYVHMRLEHPALSHADFQKSVDLGNKEAEYPLKIARDVCPSLKWEGKSCAASAASPSGTSASVASPATNTEFFWCGLDVAMPPTCTQMNTLFTKDVANTWSCPPDVAKPSGCDALFPSASSATAPPTPTVPPSEVAATEPAKPEASPEEKPGWLSWLWGSRKQATEQPPASVTLAMPPPAGGASLTVKVGDKDVALIAPAGSCFLDSATTDGAAAVKNLQSELSTFEGLKVVAAYAPCGAGVPPFLSAIPHGGYFAVATDEDLSGRESEALQSACAGLSSTAGKSGRDLSGATDLSPKLAAMIPGIIEGDKAALRPVMDINSSTSGVPTGVFPAGPHACYMGLFRTGVVNHSDFIHADAILAFGPVVHGKFLGLVDWATFENADGIVAHLDRIKALHNDITRLR